MPLALAGISCTGALAALAGGYWDDAWHTERGRDEFLIAPHIAIYAGVAAAGAALALWAMTEMRRHGPHVVMRHQPLALALLGVSVTLASGPIDNAWHVAFGRDAVIWSPPHMLGLVGTIVLGAALLAELAPRPGHGARAVGAVAGALAVAAGTFVIVEYDTDVPQFDVAFYLPALGLGVAISLTLVRAASTRRWPAAEAAVLHAALIGIVSGFLVVVGFPPPAVPLVVPTAVVVDAAARRHWPPTLTAAVFTAALYATYVPVRNASGGGVRFEAADILLGVPMTAALAFLVFTVADERRRPTAGPGRTATAVAGVLAAGLLVASAPTAFGHDPGQGDDAGTVDLTVRADGRRLDLRARMDERACAATTAVAVVARRAGETIRAPLRRTGCRLSGRLEVPTRGRWFVYAESRRGTRTVETWLPVTVTGGRTVASEPNRYAYVVPRRSATVIKILGGVTLYAAMLGLLYAAFTLVRASRPSPVTPPP